MKRLNKKGFTLIELLAVIIIMGVLLLVAIPAVTKYIQQSRLKTYAQGLSGMVDSVRNEVNSFENANYTFASDEVLIVPCTKIEIEKGDNKKSPFGKWGGTDTAPTCYIAVVGNTNGFKYYVAAKDANGYGTSLVSSDKLNASQMTSLGSTTVTLPTNAGTVTAGDLTTFSLTGTYKYKVVS